MTLPLQGIRVLDLSRILAGPLCTMTLGDLGADVIKVERPGTGDDTRGWGPPFDRFGQSAYFLAVNRNKLSLTLDFNDEHDRQMLHQLADEADVIIDNYLPGSLTRSGVDKGAMMRGNARLVWCTISGFGGAILRPGYDFVVQAESGWMSITGDSDGAPHKVGVALADVIAGKDAASAIMATLIARDRAIAPLDVAERTVEVALYRSAVAALVNVAQNVLVGGADAKRWGNAHPNLVPYQLFDAADRPFVIAVGSDAQWGAAVDVLGLEALAGDSSLATNAGRVAARARVTAVMQARLSTMPASHWITRLASAGVPCGVVRTVAEALAEADASPETGVAPAFGGSVRRPPPRLGEHDATIRRHHWSAFNHLPILAHQDV